MLQTNIIGVCGECLQCKDHTGLLQLKATCAPFIYTAWAPGCSAGVLSKAGHVFHVLPRSKPLKISGTPRGHRLSWVCFLCPSQV